VKQDERVFDERKEQAITSLMQTPPRLFDPALYRLRLARAYRQGPADFLLARAADDLADRLSVITRRFPLALDWASPGPHAAEVLATSGLCDVILRASPIPAATGFGPWQTLLVDASTVPLKPQSLDLITTVFALQTIDDVPGTLLQLRHALKPDGLLIGAMLGGESLHELRSVMMDAESLCEGGVSPRVAPFAGVRDIGGLLQRAGLALPVTDSDLVTVRYDTLFDLVHDLRRMAASNPLLARRKQPLQRATLIEAARLYAERFSDPDGRIRASFELVWFSGWAPHPDQQKPLKPGSAQMRLADALKSQ
jgi:SAM-dependent methyltransferase